MEILIGKAEVQSRFAHQRRHRGATSISYASRFTIGARTVRMTSYDLAVIETGDTVIVAGDRGKDGVFNAYALHNPARGATTHCDKAINYLGPVVFIGAGLLLVPFRGFGLIFVALGVLMLAHARKMAEARRLVTAD